ncbi:MAG: ammonia channel protein, partial [Stellaceae bacterium]
SMVIGVAAGIIPYLAVIALKAAMGYDDALDAFGVHAVGGATGAILTGVFAVSQYGGTPGLIEGNPLQLWYQIEGVVIVIAYDVVVSFILLKLIDVIIGLRVSEDVEREGLDLALHGEAVQ